MGYPPFIPKESLKEDSFIFCAAGGRMCNTLKTLYSIFALFVKPVEKISHIRYPVGQNPKDILVTEVTKAKEGFKIFSEWGGAALRGRPQDGQPQRVAPTIFKNPGEDCLVVFDWHGCGYPALYY
jgi:hypothetical protein